MKMFVTPNFVQHNRLIRLVMLLIIVGLSIFLYTSYYANQTMERFPTSQRFHMPSLISVSSMLEAEASASAGTGNAIDDDNTFQNNGINDKTGIDSNSNNNKLVQPADSAVIDTSNDSQIRQQLLGNNLIDNLSNSVAQFNVNNIVQQTNLPGELTTLYA